MARRPSDLRSGDLLPVLQRADHAALAEIVEALDRSWDVRIKADARYLEAAQDLTQAPDLVADYLTRAGGNAISNAWRGGGPSYQEVLQDVCGVMDVAITEDMDALAMEERLLLQVMERVWNEMAPQEREQLVRPALDVLQKAGHRFDAVTGDKLFLLPLSALVAQLGMRVGGYILAQAAVQVGSLFARGLLANAAALMGNALVGRMLAVVIGPVGWAAAGVWTVVEALGPSYRGVAPAVFHVAVLRQRFLWEENEEGDVT